MTIAWPMVTGACVTLALINLRIAFGDVPRAPHILFLLSAISVAIISLMELALLQSSDVQTSNAVFRWASVPIGLMVGSVAGFVGTFFGTGRKWIGIAGVSVTALAELANLLSGRPAVRHAVEIQRFESFGGVPFSVSTIQSGPWSVVEIIGVLIVAIYVLDASVMLWKRGGRRRAVIVGGSIIFFFTLSRGHAALVEMGVVHTPYFVSFSFLAVLLAMGHELSDEVVRASALARDLRESERRMDLAARSARLGFWTWDILRNEIWATDAAREMFEIPADERITLERFLESLHPDDREPVKQAIGAAVNGAGDYEKNYRIMVSQGRLRWIAARGAADFDARGKAVRMRGVLLDVTSQRQSQDELEQVRAQLAQVDRVSMLSQLGAALAHELNQPLGAILRNAETAEILLQASDPDLDEIRAIVGDIRRDDQRASKVIDRLRALLKRRSIDAVPLKVEEVLGEVMALVRSDAAGRNVELKLTVDADLPLVMGDRVHLQQVLLNLIFNSVDALTGAEGAGGLVLLRARKARDGFLEILVEDNGTGISADILDQIFEPFFTTKPDGTGLGLPISRTIIEALGGHLTAENREEGGAIFRLTLRLASDV